MLRLTLLLATLACAGATEPHRPLVGDLYVLDSIEGRPLPAPYAHFRDWEAHILADTLALDTAGVGTRRSLVETERGSGRTRLEEINLRWTRSGDRVEISFVCPDLGLCIAPPHFVGRATAAGLRFDSSVVTRQPLVYRRVP